MENGAVTLEGVWQFLKWLNVVPGDPTDPLLGVNPRELKTGPHKNL